MKIPDEIYYNMHSGVINSCRLKTRTAEGAELYPSLK
jgi:hypothetical protein